MPLRDKLYTADVTTVKRYGSRYKMTYSKFLRNSGVVSPPPPKRSASENSDPPARLECNLSRARSTVYELSMCNPWEYFCTFTLADDRGFDRDDLGLWHKDFAQWLRNLRRNHGGAMAYLIVPENHKDGAWHMHALMSGIPDKLLRRFTLDETLPYKIRAKVRAGDELYDWPGYRKKYGWVTVSAIRDHDKCAGYITKYVTKALTESSLMACEHLFFSSHGLARAELISRGYMHHPADYPWDYSNDYVSIKWADDNIFGSTEARQFRPRESLIDAATKRAEKANALDEREGKTSAGLVADFKPVDLGGMVVSEGNLFLAAAIFDPDIGGILGEFVQEKL